MALLTNRSLRQKLTLVALVTVIAAQVCAAIVLVGLERGRARRSVVTGLEALSRIVVDNTAAAVDFGDPDAATDMLRSLGAQEGFERACLYNHNQQLFATFALSGSCDGAPAPDGASFDLGVAYSAPVMSPQRGRVGTLTLWNSLSPVNDRLRQQTCGGNRDENNQRKRAPRRGCDRHDQSPVWRVES